MAFFDSSSIYIDSATSLRAKIARIDAVIDALFTVASTAAANGDISEYSLDDGQTKIRTVYKTAADVMSSIQVFETQRQTYINRLNGRSFRLMDSKNFPSTKGGRYGRR